MINKISTVFPDTQILTTKLNEIIGILNTQDVVIEKKLRGVGTMLSLIHI